jgi:hypothetical protein
MILSHGSLGRFPADQALFEVINLTPVLPACRRPAFPTSISADDNMPRASQNICNLLLNIHYHGHPCLSQASYGGVAFRVWLRPSTDANRRSAYLRLSPDAVFSQIRNSPRRMHNSNHSRYHCAHTKHTTSLARCRSAVPTVSPLEEAEKRSRHATARPASKFPIPSSRIRT